MSGLSPEALASLGGLNLQDVKADLRFSPAEKKKPLTVELDWLEKTSIQFWNFDTVLEKLNALGTKTTPRENVVFPKAEEDIPSFWKGLAREDEGPDWLMSPFPAAEEAPSSQRQEWNALSLAQQENDLFRWSDKFKRGEPIEDWQLQAVKDNRIYLGDAEESSSPQTEELTPREAWMALPEDQRGRDLQRWKLKKYLGEPLEYWQEKAIEGQEDEEKEVDGGGEEEDLWAETEAEAAPTVVGLGAKKEKLISAEGMKVAFKSYLSTWLNKNKLAVPAHLAEGALVGFVTNLCFTELVAHDRRMAGYLSEVLRLTVGSIIAITNIFEAGVISTLALRGRRELVERQMRASSIAERLAVSKSAGNLIDRMLLVAPVSAKAMRDIAIHPATTGFVAGFSLYAALSGAGVFGESGLTHQAHAVSPADSGGAGAGAGQEQTGGHSTQPDMESLRAQGKIDMPTLSDGQPPAGGGVDVNPQFPSPDSPMMPVNPEDLGQLPKLPEIDIQKIVDSLPKKSGVAQLPDEQQLGASHWRLAEAWSEPLADSFGLSDDARTFFTDAIKDLTQDQGNIRLDSVVKYDKHHIGDYLSESIAKMRETDPAGWNLKFATGDVDRLQKIAELLKNAK